MKTQKTLVSLDSGLWTINIELQNSGMLGQMEYKPE